MPPGDRSRVVVRRPVADENTSIAQEQKKVNFGSVDHMAETRIMEAAISAHRRQMCCRHVRF